MKMVACLFKNAFEKLFNCSNLKVDKDPFIVRPNSQSLQYQFNGILQEKPVFVMLFNPSAVIKKFLLSKHNALIPLLNYKQSQFSYSSSNEQLNGEFLCIIVPVFTPVIYSKLEYFDCLSLLKTITEALVFIYDQLELQISNIDDSTISFVQSNSQYIFSGFDNVVDNGVKSNQAVKQLIMHLNSKQSQKFDILCMQPSKYLQSETFNNPLFQVIQEADDQSKLKDQLYLKQLGQAITQISAEQLFQCLLPKLLITCQNAEVFIEHLYPIFIQAINIVLERQKVHNVIKNFNQIFDFVCRQLQVKPQQLLPFFMELHNLERVSENAASCFSKISLYFLGKNAMNNPMPLLPQAIDYFVKQIMENTVVMCRSIDMQTLCTGLALQISTFTINRNVLISWNSFLIISNLITFYNELKSKIGDKINEVQEGTFIGLRPFDIYKTPILQSALKAIEAGNYDFIQAAYLINLCLPKSALEFKKLNIPYSIVGQLLQSFHSCKSVHLGVICTNKKQRQLVRNLVQKLYDVGLDMQLEQEEIKQDHDNTDEKAEKKDEQKDEDKQTQKQVLDIGKQEDTKKNSENKQVKSENQVKSWEESQDSDNNQIKQETKVKTEPQQKQQQQIKVDNTKKKETTQQKEVEKSSSSDSDWQETNTKQILLQKKTDKKAEVQSKTVEKDEQKQQNLKQKEPIKPEVAQKANSKAESNEKGKQQVQNKNDDENSEEEWNTSQPAKILSNTKDKKENQNINEKANESNAKPLESKVQVDKKIDNQSKYEPQQVEKQKTEKDTAKNEVESSDDWKTQPKKPKSKKTEQNTVSVNQKKIVTKDNKQDDKESSGSEWDGKAAKQVNPQSQEQQLQQQSSKPTISQKDPQKDTQTQSQQKDKQVQPKPVKAVKQDQQNSDSDWDAKPSKIQNTKQESGNKNQKVAKENQKETKIQETREQGNQSEEESDWGQSGQKVVNFKKK